MSRECYDLFNSILWREDALRRIKYPRIRDPRRLREAIDTEGNMSARAYYTELGKRIDAHNLEKAREAVA